MTEMQEALPMEIKSHPRKRRKKPQPRMVIGPAVFNMFFNHKMSRVDALSELIDNAFGPAAGNASTCWIKFGNKKIVVSDDGVGVRDLNAIMTPGESGSRDDPEDIGSYGVGAKYGMFHFGTKVKIDTVREDGRHIHEIDFALAQRRNQMPRLYTGDGATTNKPHGTEIIITNLHEGRHNPSYKYLCERLAHRYLLAQRAGKKIVVSWPHSGGELVLHGEDVVHLFEQDVREYNDEINGKPFTVLAGDIKDYHHDLSGLHIGYGFRFIKKLEELAGHTLPALFYGRVILGKEWKTCLLPDKTDFVRDGEALEAKVYALLKDWIEELRKLSEEHRTSRICTKLSAFSNKLLAGGGEVSAINSDEDEDGGNRGGGDGDHEPKPGPDPESKHKTPKKDDAGHNDADPLKETGVRFAYEALGEKTPYRVGLDNRGLCVTFNSSMPNIAYAWAAPFKFHVIWGIAAMAIAVSAATNPNWAKRMLCDHTVMGEVELDTNDGICMAIERVAAHLMAAEPNQKEFAEDALDARTL
jgi:Histidine kinase-, DNA gyrase B-, and HSP90-like ATPase